ncbi:hypothetical protein P8935_18015 [Telmatobacter sp. DSM 110680]|uniref:Uncharacterized protein n=1 Tax=Telmatobacter sp. DSM 110680 TaxID=3036704 RepID=A0AAU7DI39_9BACT
MAIEPRPAPDAKRKAAGILVILCAVISLGLVLWVGRHNHSGLLALMFAIWVETPFVGLIWLGRISARWTASWQQSMYALMHVISLASVAIYAAVAFLKHLAKPAAPFLFIPAVTWMVIAAIW